MGDSSWGYESRLEAGWSFSAGSGTVLLLDMDDLRRACVRGGTRAAADGRGGALLFESSESDGGSSDEFSMDEEDERLAAFSARKKGRGGRISKSSSDELRFTRGRLLLGAR